ncbi:SDR family oxidoreductase [Mesorhizobium sp. CAU 1741]|uniref:SDR family NAD(P)-dependent oxidoreductase n=1 Tax=Mesorhizobium sp. CAU 1741 TaxID=3140366 RepID=UPI00325A936D
MDLSGKTYMVLGAGQGIGLATVELLAQAGASVCCVDRDRRRAAAAAASVGGEPVEAELGDEEQLAGAFRHAFAWKDRLDGVIDIVGASNGGWIDQQSQEAVAGELALNLTHKFSVVRQSAAHLSNGGSITFVGSVAGVMSLPRQTAYGAAKAALHHLVAGAAAELGHRGIRVNAVAPGFVRTPRMLDRFSTAQWQEVAAETPLQRAGEVSEIAQVLVFLASPLASFVTGQTIVADGGLTLPLKVMRAGSDGQIRGVR